MYGNEEPLLSHWDAMVRHMDFVEKNGLSDEYCDWLSPVRNDKPFKALLCDAFVVWDAQMMHKMAVALGKEGEADRYGKLAEERKSAWRAKYLDKDGVVKEELGCQTAYAYALHLGLVEGVGRDRTVMRLLDDVKMRKGRIGTGFLGTAIICQVLVDVGHADVAYDLLLNRAYPGWLYSVDQGATTIWERWDSYTKERGFGEASMNSFNHYAYGAVMGWLYRDAAGIRPLKPGFSEIEIAPHPDPRLGSLECEYETPHGTVSVRWRYRGGKLEWSYSAPEGIKVVVREP
jgi:hypothetical protein